MQKYGFSKENAFSILYIIPVANFIDVVYSCDRYFIKICEEYGIKLISPVEEWVEV